MEANDDNANGEASDVPPHIKEYNSALDKGTLLGVGNPLLDITATADTAFLKKYNLEANNAVLADDRYSMLCGDLVMEYNAEYIPGGATLNAIKVAQWMLGNGGGEADQVTTFMGCIGRDFYGQILQERCDQYGINTRFQVTDKAPTGTCACIITGAYHANRSLVANLAAANCFTKSHLDAPHNWTFVECAKYFYISGFFLTVSPESIMDVARHAAARNKVFTMNLAAAFLCQYFKEPLMKAMPYVDILFGNETEAAKFVVECIPDAATDSLDLKEIALAICELPKENLDKKRIVVLTHGANPTVVAYKGKAVEYPTMPILPKDIVDTTGAGDAFVGGFLSQLIIGKEIPECMRAGHYAANIIIKRHGSKLPKLVTDGNPMAYRNWFGLTD